MIDDNPFAPRSITCLIHRKQKVTHICTDFSCQQNPFLCTFCFSDLRWRIQHPHESSIKAVVEGVQWLTSIIRNQSKSIDFLYQRTIGAQQSQLIKQNLQKGVLLSQQLDNRLDNLRLQLQLQMELLIKQFQKQIKVEKQQFMRKLDDYKRNYLNNLQVTKRECIDLLSFQNSLKFYNNSNNFTMKLISQTEKRSQEWLLQQKKILMKISQSLQSNSFSTNLSYLLNRINKSNLMAMPSWKTERRQSDIQKQIHNCIKVALNSWIQLPQVIELQPIKSSEYTNSNKFIGYSTSI